MSSKQVSRQLQVRFLRSEWNKHLTNTRDNKHKMPMGNNAQLRNQFKSMKTFKQSFDYIYDKIGPVILEEKILKLKLA